MLHKPFRHVDELKGVCDMFAVAYTIFLLPGNVPPSLEDDIRRLEQQQRHHTEENEEDNREVHVYIHCMCSA